MNKEHNLQIHLLRKYDTYKDLYKQIITKRIIVALQVNS